MQNLPLGISNLSTIRDNDMVYVDKTDLAWEMVRLPSRYFLSRPRRFGKTLFVDTLQQIFEGNKRLFEGLYIYDKWDWSKKYPVIKIDFADGRLSSRKELDVRIWKILRQNCRRLGVEFELENDIPGAMADIIEESRHKYGLPAVVLIDEYDKPILDNIENKNIAKELREGLKNLYSVLKGQDANIQFIFMTGVSKFSKVSIFSGLNQLNDITIDERFSAICGYTQKDLEIKFGIYLKDINWDKVKRWYNGYNWLGEDKIYNPYDILLFILKKYKYRNYWFETGSPEFLIKLFRAKNYFLPNLNQLRVTEEILNSFDIENINPVSLLFQSGYLTIDHSLTHRERLMFVLRVPNQEVKIALYDQFLNAYTDLADEKIRFQDGLYDLLATGDLAGIGSAVTRLFAGIPWRNFTHNDLAESEGYYASVLYAFLVSLNARIIPEDISNHGQVDLTAMLGDYIYVMEIKVVQDKGPDDNIALAQVREKKYARKYTGLSGKKVYELGMIFSRTERNLVRMDWSEVKS